MHMLYINCTLYNNLFLTFADVIDENHELIFLSIRYMVPVHQAIIVNCFLHSLDVRALYLWHFKSVSTLSTVCAAYQATYLSHPQPVSDQMVPIKKLTFNYQASTASSPFACTVVICLMFSTVFPFKRESSLPYSSCLFYSYSPLCWQKLTPTHVRIMFFYWIFLFFYFVDVKTDKCSLAMLYLYRDCRVFGQQSMYLSSAGSCIQIWDSTLNEDQSLSQKRPRPWFQVRKLGLRTTKRSGSVWFNKKVFKLHKVVFRIIIIITNFYSRVF